MSAFPTLGFRSFGLHCHHDWSWNDCGTDRWHRHLVPKKQKLLSAFDVPALTFDVCQLGIISSNECNHCFASNDFKPLPRTRFAQRTHSSSFFWRICLSCSHQSCWFNLSHEHSGDSLRTFAALGVQALRASLLKVVVRLFSPVWPLTAVRSPWWPCGRSRKWLLLPVGGRPSFLMNGWRQMVGKPGKGLVGVSVSSLNVGTLWNISNCVEWSLQEISEGNQRRLEDALDLLDYGAQKPLLRYRTESNSFPQCYVAVPSWLPHHVEKLKIRKAWEILLCLFYDGPIINMHWEWFFLKHEVECFSNLVCQAGVGPKASATNHWLGWQAIWSHSCEYALEWPCPWDFEGSAWWTVPSIESQSMGWLDEESSGCSHCAREDLVQLHCFFRLPLRTCHAETQWDIITSQGHEDHSEKESFQRAAGDNMDMMMSFLFGSDASVVSLKAWAGDIRFGGKMQWLSGGMHHLAFRSFTHNAAKTNVQQWLMVAKLDTHKGALVIVALVIFVECCLLQWVKTLS